MQRAQRAMRDVFPGGLGGRTPVADPFAPKIAPGGASPGAATSFQITLPSGGSSDPVYACQWYLEGTPAIGSAVGMTPDPSPAKEIGDVAQRPTVSGNSLLLSSAQPERWHLYGWLQPNINAATTQHLSFTVDVGLSSQNVFNDTLTPTRLRSYPSIPLSVHGEALGVTVTSDAANAVATYVSATLTLICYGPTALYNSTGFWGAGF